MYCTYSRTHQRRFTLKHGYIIDNNGKKHPDLTATGPILQIGAK